MKLADLQKSMQQDVLNRTTQSISMLKVPYGQNVKSRLEVYQNAYKLRLVEILGVTHPILWTYMGDEAFWKMANQYFDVCPSNHPNARWVASRLPDFLSTDKEYFKIPVLGELASLERAIEDAFDAKDGELATMESLANIPPGQVEGMHLQFPNSLFLLAFKYNSFDIYQALKKEQSPPASQSLSQNCHVIVWRKDETSRYREILAEEAMLLESAQSGKSFSTLCEMASVMDDPETSAGRVAGYLTNWIQADLVSKFFLE